MGEAWTQIKVGPAVIEWERDHAREQTKGAHFTQTLSLFLISYNAEVFLTPVPPEPHHYTVKNVKELLTGQTAKPQNLHQYKVGIKYWDNEVEQLEKSASYLPGKTVLIKCGSKCSIEQVWIPFNPAAVSYLFHEFLRPSFLFWKPWIHCTIHLKAINCA